MDKASLLALVASNIYQYGGDLSIDDAVSLAGEIIATAEAEVRQEVEDAAQIVQTRQTRQTRTRPAKPLVERRDIDSEEDCPF